MKRSRAEFVVSAAAVGDLPQDGLPEIVMAGRSNVGKSSLINKLTGSRKLARTSSTPGKTQWINFYRIHDSFFLVDLPGFGYSKAGKKKSREWKRLVEQYFRNRPEIVLVIHLVDARLPPTALDIDLQEWLDHMDVTRIIAATKADKLSGNARAAQMRVISGEFGSVPVIFCSAVTGLGCKDIWKRMTDVIGGGPKCGASARV